MKRPRLLACGELLWDLLPEGQTLGGAPVNFACHAALQGAQATILSAVGEDPHGEQALNILIRFGLNTSLVQRHADTATGTAKVILNSAGLPGFEITANTAWDYIEYGVELDARLGDIDAIYFGTLGQRGSLSRATIRRVVGLAHERGLCRVLDVNLRRPFYDDRLIRESVALASVLKLSDEELPEVARACGVVVKPDPSETLRNLRERFGLQMVILTRGSLGALLVSSNETIDQPGIPCIVRDTVGAGDSFTAAVAVGFLRGEPLATVLRKACETASVVCSHVGAVPAPPRG